MSYGKDPARQMAGCTKLSGEARSEKHQEGMKAKSSGAFDVDETACRLTEK